jgi:hypothetical protein
MRTGQPLPSAPKACLMVNTSVTEQGLVEVAQTLLAIRIEGRLHLLQHVGMTADGPLAKENHAARQDVRPFDGDADRHLLIGAANEVRWAQTDPLAADDVHAVIDHLAGTLGHMVFGDRRDHRRLLAEVDGAGRHLAHGVHHVGVGTDAGQRFFDTLEAPDRHLELAAHTRVGTDRASRQLRHAGVRRRQRDRATRRQTLHQHAPTLANHRRATDHVIERHEDILATRRAIHEHGVQAESGGDRSRHPGCRAVPARR